MFRLFLVRRSSLLGYGEETFWQPYQLDLKCVRMVRYQEQGDICDDTGTYKGIASPAALQWVRRQHGKHSLQILMLCLAADFKRWYFEGHIRRRSKPRKVINGLVFNHELDLLEVRVQELGDAVDHYLVVESPYTYFGTQKPLYLKNNLSAGFLREHKHKIVPISVDFYNYAGGDPWGPENYFRTSVWYEGHRRLTNIRDDDLFIMSDADEIPSRDVVLFLKHHDGFGEPMKLRLRWFVYGFFWENSMPIDVSGVCTAAYIRDVYEDDSVRLRRMETFSQENMPNTGTLRETWTITGNMATLRGVALLMVFRCGRHSDEACSGAEGRRSAIKLASAQKDDREWWGDMAEKTDSAYIYSLKKKSLAF
ncbi:hypothetical protein MRX96_001779 [Rhipicephalus microplus]